MNISFPPRFHQHCIGIEPIVLGAALRILAFDAVEPEVMRVASGLSVYKFAKHRADIETLVEELRPCVNLA